MRLGKGTLPLAGILVLALTISAAFALYPGLSRSVEVAEARRGLTRVPAFAATGQSGSMV